MKPTRVVMRRAPSRPTTHKDVALTTCDAPLELRLSRSAIRGFDWLVLYRCPECDTRRLTNHEEAPAIALWGVLPEGAVSEWRDEDGDVDDDRAVW